MRSNDTLLSWPTCSSADLPPGWRKRKLLSNAFLKLTCQHEQRRYNTAGSDSVTQQLMLKMIAGTGRGKDSSVSKKTNKTLPGPQRLLLKPCKQVKALPLKCWWEQAFPRHRDLWPRASWPQRLTDPDSSFGLERFTLHAASQWISGGQFLQWASTFKDTGSVEKPELLFCCSVTSELWRPINDSHPSYFSWHHHYKSGNKQKTCQFW